MPSSSLRLLADLVLLLHLGIVLFVVGGLVLIVAGNALRWSWVNAPAFRFAHLAAIVYVVAQQWLGAVCPLTTLENWLRTQAGESGYAGGFVEHWVQWLLFYDAPGWVFTLVYTAFGLAVAAVWIAFPPRRGPRLRGG
ncbi:DUF2784 domain-containing protein [Ramlibacter henchirensis]|uniref:DUF2784 domain-containing protein n=1 Tax=Ramlibacter henchirensis TaxID=204072 RepID=A0A4Z0BW10_9BURK|nr:DUF2784 domain-containing protein [Ramlibacter henchirensis]TFZ02235.1 DUF2784 domain-containing protein [Ramlibacter henchirensis]